MRRYHFHRLQSSGLGRQRQTKEIVGSAEVEDFFDCASNRPILKYFDGVAFFSRIQHPEPTGSRRATPLRSSYFKHQSGTIPCHGKP
jgi:hypothetical protein